jgi:four helix bundle protein
MGSDIRRFEDLIAWQKARALSSAVYRVTGSGSFAKDYELMRQIRRAVISIMSNIAEGYERGKPSELHQFLCVAKGSCAEVRSQLHTALDANHLTEPQFHELMAIAVETGRVIGGLRASVERRRDGEA